MQKLQKVYYLDLCYFKKISNDMKQFMDIQSKSYKLINDKKNIIRNGNGKDNTTSIYQ